VKLAQYVDGDLYREIQGLTSRYESTTLGRALSGVLRGFDKYVTTPTKLGAVALNPSFSIPNFIRDNFAFWMQSKHTGAWERFWAPIEKTAQYAAYTLANKKNPYAEVFDALGGRVEIRTGSIRKAVPDIRGELLARTKLQKFRAKFLKRSNVINSIQDLFSIGEGGVRLAEFVGSIHGQGYHYDYAADSWVETESGDKVETLPRRVVTAASTAANEVTTNFRRKGTYSRLIDRVVPFFSANVAGTARGLIGAKELIKSPQAHKRQLGLAMLLAFGGLAWALGHDDDWYKDMDPELKNRFWFFALPDGTPFLRIPKPYEYGAIVNTMEGLLDLATGNGLKRFPEAAWGAIEMAAPPVRPAGVSTIWELQMNKDRWGRSIEPLGMVEKGLHKEYRSKAYTTGLGKFLSHFLSNGQYGLSPIQVDYLADQWTGGGYTQVVNTVEGLAKGDLRLETAPVFKRFLLRSDHQQTVKNFYDAYEELKGAVATAKFLNPDTKRPDAIRQAQLQQWTRYRKALGEIWGSSAGATPEEQRELERYAVGMADYALGQPARKHYPNPLEKTDKPVPAVIEQIREEYIAALGHAMTSNPQPQRGEAFLKYKDRFLQAGIERKWAAEELRRLGYKPIDIVTELRTQAARKHRTLGNESARDVLQAMQMAP
jgi:hypothetical protein